MYYGRRRRRAYSPAPAPPPWPWRSDLSEGAAVPIDVRHDVGTSRVASKAPEESGYYQGISLAHVVKLDATGEFYLQIACVTGWEWYPARRTDETDSTRETDREA